MRIESLKSKYRSNNAVIKAALSLSNVYSASLDYLNDLNFLFFSLPFNSLIKKSMI